MAIPEKWVPTKTFSQLRYASQLNLQVLGTRFSSDVFLSSRLLLQVLGNRYVPGFQVSALSMQVLGTASNPVTTSRVSGLLLYALGTRPFHKEVEITEGLEENLTEFFAANWSNSIQVSRDWRTTISSSSITGAEDRRGLRARPLRTISGNFSGLNLNFDPLRDHHGSEGMKALFQACQRTSISMPFPLYSEVSDLEEAVEASASTLPMDTTYRDLWIGQRILVYEPIISSVDPTERINKFSIGEIADINPGSLILASPIGKDFGIGAFVFPLIEVDLELSHSGSLESGDIVTLNFSASEIAGVTTLPGAHSNLRHPPSIEEFQRHPVWTASANWSELPQTSIERAGVVEQKYQGTLTTPKEFPRSTFEFMASFDTREELWAFEQFFDRVAGRLYSFWLVDPLSRAFAAPVIQADYIDVRAMGDLDAAKCYGSAIAVIDTAGEVDLGVITTVEELFTTPKKWRFRFQQGTAPQPKNTHLESVTFAHLVRFADDELVVEYVTNSVVRSTLRFIEVGDEGLKYFDSVQT